MVLRLFFVANLAQIAIHDLDCLAIYLAPNRYIVTLSLVGFIRQST